jgi:hypothetical protein
MNPGIFLISDNEELIEMSEQTYESEKLLQTWLAQYPALLVGNQIDAKEPKRFLLIEQECGVPGRQAGADRWSIDHLFIDQDAIPTIVEVKRSNDTRIRREVVGQMLDYAANAAEHWRVDHMRERFAASCQRRGADATSKLKEFLGENVDPEEFWEKANRNLQERKLRLLFIADVIPTELQRIVEFLNEQMDHTEVLAIEIKQFVGQQGLRSLVPRVIGQTTKAQSIKGKQRRTTTNEDEFFAHLNKRSPEAARAARKILDWAIEKGLPINWRGASFVPIIDYGGAFTHNPITVIGSSKIPRVGIKFGRMRNRQKLSEKQRLELLRLLNDVPGVNLPSDSIEKFPSIPLSTLAKESRLEQFLAAIEGSIDQVREQPK